VQLQQLIGTKTGTDLNRETTECCIARRNASTLSARSLSHVVIVAMLLHIIIVSENERSLLLLLLM
jgi:hypothetical protein